ncbi:MAG: hypothetical protein ABJC26_05625 [Gemmatimonadaceae bacterium]
MKIIGAFVVALLLFAMPTKNLTAQEFKVVVNNSVSDNDISAKNLARIFLKQTDRFPNGQEANPVYQLKDAACRAAFDKAVLGKTVAGVETFWQQQIFSGRDVPPASKTSDETVIAFVRATPGGIGYVSAGASAVGVKVIAIR